MRSRITIIVILLIILIGVIGCCFLMAETEVESYTIGMEIIEKDFSSYYKIYEGKKTIYIINAKGSGEAFVQEVSPKIYANYEVGEIVDVKVTVFEDNFGNFRKEYKILGLIPLREKEE